jgi:hypothetical protein
VDVSGRIIVVGEDSSRARGGTAATSRNGPHSSASGEPAACV